MKKRRIIKKILIIIVSLLFLISTYAMLSKDPEQMKFLSKLNLSYPMAFGLINIIIALSLWTKRTRRIGILIATAYLGGAIASELSVGGTGLIPGLAILILWIVQKLDGWNCSCGTCDSCVKKVTLANSSLDVSQRPTPFQ